jgi:hypothetical protein
MAWAFVVWGRNVRLKSQGLQVQTWLRSMDLWDETSWDKFPGRDFKAVDLKSVISGSLKKLNSEQIGL